MKLDKFFLLQIKTDILPRSENSNILLFKYLNIYSNSWIFIQIVEYSFIHIHLFIFIYLNIQIFEFMVDETTNTKKDQDL